jgi:hypothetical protein
MRTPGEMVESNFGQRPFLFDLNSVLHEEQEQFLSSILHRTPPLPHCENIESSLLSIVQEYLLHQGYSNTAMELANNIQRTSAEPSSESAAIAEQLKSTATRQRMSCATHCSRVNTLHEALTTIN